MIWMLVLLVVLIALNAVFACAEMKAKSPGWRERATSGPSGSRP